MAFREDAMNLMHAGHFSGNFAFLVDAASVESAMGDVDTLVRRALEHKRALLTHRNTLLPVARLPPEILSYIFRYCAPTPACTPFDGSILAFSQVCSRWRSIALEDARIWTTPVCLYPKLAMTMLERTKNLPLDITVDCASKPACYNAAGAALTRGSQLERLQLTGTPSDLRNLILLVTRPMPLLTDLTLYCTLPIYLPKADLTAPNLRRLCLDRCLLPPTAKVFHNLTVLEISLNGSELQQIDVGDIIGIVKQNPGLQKLVLKGTAFSSHPALSPPGGKVTLPYLETLHMHDELYCIRTLFQHFRFPVLTDLRLSNNRAASLTEFRTFLALLNQWLQAESFHEHIQALAICVFNHDAFELDIRCGDGDAWRRNGYKIHASFQVAHDILSDAVDQVSHTFQLDDVVEARIDSAPFAGLYSHLRPFVTTLATLPRLTGLISNYTAWLSWADVMENEEWDGPMPPFGSLNLLHLYYARMLDSSEEDTPRRFARVLQRLAQAGRPIGTVYLKGIQSDVDVQDFFANMGLHVTLDSPTTT